MIFFDKKKKKKKKKKKIFPSIYETLKSPNFVAELE
jgi:hypothetical protein